MINSVGLSLTLCDSQIYLLIVVRPTEKQLNICVNIARVVSDSRVSC